ELLACERRLQLRVRPDATRDSSGNPGDQVNELLSIPREWLSSAGEITSFTTGVVREVWSLRVLRFFGESLRQSGILIVGSTAVILRLVISRLIINNVSSTDLFNQSIGSP